MNTMTFKVVLGNNQSTTVSINIIGTNLYIDYGDGTTTIQEPNTISIEENHPFSNSSDTEKTWTVTITGNITGLGHQFLYIGGSRVTEITLPEGLQTIDSWCLYGIQAEEIIIPSTVTTIGKSFLSRSAVEEVVSRNLAAGQTYSTQFFVLQYNSKICKIT